MVPVLQSIFLEDISIFCRGLEDNVKRSFFSLSNSFFLKNIFCASLFRRTEWRVGEGGGVADPQMKAQLTCGAGGLRLVLLRSVPSNSSVFT